MSLREFGGEAGDGNVLAKEVEVLDGIKRFCLWGELE